MDLSHSNPLETNIFFLIKGTHFFPLISGKIEVSSLKIWQKTFFFLKCQAFSLKFFGHRAYRFFPPPKIHILLVISLDFVSGHSVSSALLLT